MINNNTNSGSWPFVGRLVDCEKLTTVRSTVQRLARSKPQRYNEQTFNRLNHLQMSKRKYYRKCDNSILWDVKRNEKFNSIPIHNTPFTSYL
ncbi:hypothetical protein T4C_7309 [Trichinella pseudospiralis]|uniref:Uncharacterized protein n=1 Tax=Trichinella pseudospiralis TaxID=6337 RepID=A0A0V1KB08_TRIPS|nr:hypothetical protein T4C_7309 [Trichinella pseudospiralis]